MFFCICIFQALRCGEYPGLYFDAVNPDYLAVQFLYPQIENPRWTLPHTGLPWLAQLYHGTMTVWLQSLVIGVVGEASILTFRITNATYVMGICWCVYLIAKQIKTNKFIAFVGIIAMLMSPQAYSFVRTQYYIKLPGTLLLLFSLYCLLMCNNYRKNVYLLLFSGVLGGLAFYSYFIYIFFVPAMMLILLFQVKKICNRKIGDVFIWLTGFASGSVLYIIGYFDLLITSSDIEYNVKAKIVYLFTLVTIVFFAALCLLITNYYNDRKKLKHIVYGLLPIFFVGIMITTVNLGYIVSVIVPHLNSINVAGEKMGLGGRVRQFFLYWVIVMNNSCFEKMILGTNTSIFSQIYIVVFVLLSATIGVTYIKYKYRNKVIKVIGIFWMLLASYFLCSLLFISRMGAQHFTPVFFITYIIIILEVGYLYSVCESKVKLFLVGVLVMLAVIGSINSNLFIFNIKNTGGHGYYSSQINRLAENALSRKLSGEKEVYIFPEWGLLCNFNYLTSNQIPIMTDIDEGKIRELLGQGYNINVCAWDRGMEKVYCEKLENIGGGVEAQYTFSNDGTEAFYVLSLDG